MSSIMSLQQQAEVAILLLLAAFLSGLIGMDRERREKDAGMRTHMLVGVGACLFTALSRYAFAEADTSRVASNVVTGVGFLGAGVIWQSKHGVHALTTAASVWLVAAIGMAVGAGAWLLATSGTVTIWIILAVFQYLPFLRTDGVGYKFRRRKKSKDKKPQETPATGPQELVTLEL